MSAIQGAPSVLGVCGAGTMGAGIAQLGCMAGMRTRLHDPDPAALERGVDGIARRLEREVTRGRLDAQRASVARDRLMPAPILDELA
ncbi:MAG: 3-hydroxyacyl-CoA dehydrogenase NAD-binding domain-containing protein, partial [Solirubrobacteraceae bacterium]